MRHVTQTKTVNGITVLGNTVRGYVSTSLHAITDSWVTCALPMSVILRAIFSYEKTLERFLYIFIPVPVKETYYQ